MKRIVVTGALGHIGSRLIRELPAAFPEAEIVMIDDLSTQRYASLFDLPREGRYRFHEADILETDLAALFAGADAVIHLAAITDPASFGQQELLERVNLMGTERVARACITTGSPLFFPSTTSVYGTSAADLAEDCPELALVPQSPYAASKRRAEQLLSALGRAEGLRFVICRFGTIFGVSPGMRFHTAVNKFAWQACMGTPLSVWRSALLQQRPYLDLGDAMGALSLILRRRLFDGQTYNVLTLNTTVEEIIAGIRSHVPDLKIRYVDSPIMNHLSYTVSCEKFKALGFRPTGDLSAGIAATIALLRTGQHACLPQ